MKIINYEKMCQVTDVRIVKTRQAVFRAIMTLIAEKDFESISITELCKSAMINRKTFYVHYSSMKDAFNDLELSIARGFIGILLEHQVVTSHSFDAGKYLFLVNTIVEENIKDFDLLYPYLKLGTLIGKLGAEVGKLAFQFMAERPSNFDARVYPFSLVFTLSGLLTSYFDWIDFGRQFPIEELIEISQSVVSTPLESILTSEEP